MNKLFIIATLIVITTSQKDLKALTLKKSVEEALLTNYEISSNNLKTKSDEIEIDIQKRGYYPTIDFDTKLESSDTREKRNSQSQTSWDDHTDGYNIKLKVEQLLYDGGKTPAMIREKKSNYKSSFYNTNFSNNKIILEVVKSYNNILKINSINKIYTQNKVAHDEALEIAYNKEEISGEVLETKKTQAMIYSLKHKIFTQDIDLNEAHSEFKKLTGLEAKELCDITTDESNLPNNLTELISLSYDNNLQIKEQESKIKVQQAKLAQHDSNYLPTIKARIEASHDNDIELTNNGIQEKVLGEINLNWNFYSGGKDKRTIEKSLLLLNKEKKDLEQIKLETKEDITNLYKEYENIKKRITNYKSALEANNEILTITTQQLEDGTKTFIDLLLAKSKVYETQINIITQEFLLQEKHFEILHNIGSLSETILNQNEQPCYETKPVLNIDSQTKNQDKEETIESLLEEVANDKNESEETPIDAKAIDSNTTVEETLQPIENNTSQAKQPVVIQNTLYEPDLEKPLSLENELKGIYEQPIFVDNDIKYDEKSLAATINITSNSFTVTKVNNNDPFKHKLNIITKPLLEIIEKHKSQIKNIVIKSYTSSEHRRYQEQNDMDKANLALSQRRANKVKNFFINYANQNNLDAYVLDKTFIAKGHGSTELVIDENGLEDKVASRRIVLEVKKY